MFWWVVMALGCKERLFLQRGLYLQCINFTFDVHLGMEVYHVFILTDGDGGGGDAFQRKCEFFVAGFLYGIFISGVEKRLTTFIDFHKHIVLVDALHHHFYVRIAFHLLAV